MVLNLEDVRVTPGGSVEVPTDEEPAVKVQVDGGELTVFGQRPGRDVKSSRIEKVPGAQRLATPESLRLGTLRRADLRLREPLLLAVSREDEHVTVWSELLDEIGYGPYLTAAVEDFQQTVAELYFSLKAEQGRLGPEMIRLWQVVQGLIEERQ